MNNFKAKFFGHSDANADAQRAWRVNFVKPELLPDIKVIRTKFLVNYGCVALALVALGFSVGQELDLYESAQDLAKTNASIEALRGTDVKIREKSSLCAGYLSALDGYVSYKKSEIDFFSLYSAIGTLRSEDVVFNNLLIDLALPAAKGKVGAKIIISGKKKDIAGKSFERIEVLNNSFYALPYFKSLKGFKVSKLRAPVTAPDTQEHVINFTLELALEPL